MSKDENTEQAFIKIDNPDEWAISGAAGKLSKTAPKFVVFKDLEFSMNDTKVYLRPELISYFEEVAGGTRIFYKCPKPFSSHYAEHSIREIEVVETHAQVARALSY